MEEAPKRYMTTREATAQWGILPSVLNKLCRQGKVKGAVHEKKGYPWQIPVEAPRPLPRKQAKKAKK